MCVCYMLLYSQKSRTRPAAAVSPYKDVCSWKEGWRRGRERRMGRREERRNKIILCGIN